MTATVPPDVIEAIVAARHDDPFAVLGPHELAGAVVVRAFVPVAESLEALSPAGEPLAPLARAHPAGFFEGRLAARTPYRLRARRGAEEWTVDDPYAYGPVLGPMDDWLLGGFTTPCPVTSLAYRDWSDRSPSLN